jgi:membrane protein YdbS with pleckstrin-like domain
MHNRNRIGAAFYYLAAVLAAVLAGFFIANNQIWQAWVAGFVAAMSVVMAILTTSKRRQL